MQPRTVLDAEARTTLLHAARAGIGDGLRGADPAPPDDTGVPQRLAEPGASFVTVTVDGALQGCIGSILPSRALLLDVWHNARRAAFEDPRFPPLQAHEAGRTAISVAVLGALEPLEVDCEQALLDALRPGEDGLLLSLGVQRATFLPKVWESLPEPALFVGRLKQKMGCAADFWDARLCVERYRTEDFSAPLDEG